MRGRLAAMLALVVAGLPVAGAQSVSAQAPAQYIYVATITVEFGRIQDFEEYEHQIQEARRRVGDPRSVSAYQMQAGGAPNRFDVVIPFDDLSELDSWPSVPALLESAYGQRDGARIYAEGSATIESVEYVIQALQPDHSSGNGVNISGATLTNLVTTRIRPEMADDYQAFLAALKVAEDRRGIRRTRRTVAMGPVSTYTAVSQAAAWSSLRADPPPPAVIIEEFGEDIGGALLARANAAVLSRTIQVLRLREDLSYRPN